METQINAIVTKYIEENSDNWKKVKKSTHVFFSIGVLLFCTVFVILVCLIAYNTRIFRTVGYMDTVFEVLTVVLCPLFVLELLAYAFVKQKEQYYRKRGLEEREVVETEISDEISSVLAKAIDLVFDVTDLWCECVKMPGCNADIKFHYQFKVNDVLFKRTVLHSDITGIDFSSCDISHVHLKELQENYHSKKYGFTIEAGILENTIVLDTLSNLKAIKFVNVK